LDICREGIRSRAIGNVELYCLSAMETDLFKGREFDVIIVNSVIQYFPSHQYLSVFLSRITELLSGKGVLYLGDIRDKTMQLEYYGSLFQGQDHIEDRVAEKKLSDKELFLDRRFFSDYCQKLPYHCEISCTSKLGAIVNELSLFRYDAILKVDKGREASVTSGALYRRQIMDRPFTRESLVSPRPLNNPNDPAYLMYTSGSTGKSKGVMVEHKSVGSFFQNFRSRLYLEEGMVLAGTTQYTFDISVLELVGSFVNGLKLFLIEDVDPVYILKCISERKFNALQATPSRLAQLLAAIPESEDILGNLRVLLVGGEELGQANYQYLKNLKLTRAINVYGPTETTIWSSSLDIRESERLSIGKPLLHEQIYVLDRYFNLCPIGLPGEICIGGYGLARGYFHKPETTMEKFIPNPFAPGRIYRTGDIGRWLPDGNIEFIGRSDNQVKVRGYRIELAEIEHAILTHAQIESAVVIVRVNPAEEKELVAYLVSKSATNASDMRSYLSRLLPAYMIPAYFVLVEALPLNKCGKIDKKRLISMEGMQLTGAVAYKPPCNDVEARIESIWKQVLGRERIGVEESFFLIGGNSLNAIRVLSKLRSEFEVEMKITEVFNNPTIQFMAREVVRKVWAKKAPEISEDDLIVTI